MLTLNLNDKKKIKEIWDNIKLSQSHEEFLSKDC